MKEPRPHPRERYFKAVVPSIDVVELTPDDREFYLGFWRDADRQRYGMRIEVAIEDQDLLVMGLLQVRQDGGFDHLCLFSTPMPGVVFLARKGKPQ
jgi:hypothetical protein